MRKQLPQKHLAPVGDAALRIVFLKISIECELQCSAGGFESHALKQVVKFDSKFNPTVKPDLTSICRAPSGSRLPQDRV